MTSRPRRFAVGVAAMGVALALTYAAGLVLGAVPYPPAALQDLLVRIAPGNLATGAIEHLGHWAMRLLAIGLHLGVLLAGGWIAAALAGETSFARKARAGLAVTAALFLASVALGLTGGGMSLPAFIVYAIAAYGFGRIASGVPFGRALEPEVRQGETPLDAMRRSRRRFVSRTLAAGGLIVLAAGGALRLVFKRPPRVAIAGAGRPFVPPPGDPAFPDVAGLSPEITPNADFYNVDIDFLKPSVDASSWRLAVGGLVDAPYELNFRQLQTGFEVVEMAHTLTCISNEVGGNLISTAVWRGVRLKDVLARAGLRPGVAELVFKSAEGYSDSIPLAKANEDTTLVVFGMNGVALPREHGFPARIIVPGIYGMKNVKWLTGITAVDHHYRGYWEVRGWDDVARVKTESRFDVPAPASTVHLPASLAGVAWAGDRRVAAVEVSDDGGQTWRRAVLKRELSPVAWRLWAADVTPGAGLRRVMVRAADGTGAVQSAQLANPHPDGASGYDVLTFQVQ
ncbi:MAG TPA: molybdopterin-dependent oxidoreductase, partial [Acidimicrobiia bacterium]|nr:molybdopterin-dependent oxidoreductase [Acidimicrobiia bacterium]